MQDVTLDFETYYDQVYTLKKLMTAEYIHDPRFEVIGVSVKVGTSPAQWFSGTHDEIRDWLATIDWENSRVICHNAMFDGAILEWKFGFKPAKYFCTMMGSRPHIVPFTDSMGLHAVAAHLGIGVKGTEVENHKGRRRVAFSAQQLKEYGDYCDQDVFLCDGVWLYLQGVLPGDEQDLIDLTIKKFTRPVIVLDQKAIADRHEYIKAHLVMTLAGVESYGMNLTKLRSRTAFLDKLQSLGVTVADKATINSKGLPAIKKGMSKKDPDFMLLLAHENKEVRDLVAAKLEVTSSLEKSRLERFQRLYDCIPGHKLPVPLLYYGAHPGRFAGLDGLNLQNLPRPKAKDPDRAALRRALKAPPGWVLIAADYSNIEARIVATLARQLDLIAAFARGDDIYSSFASKIYRRVITKLKDIIERFVGKTCILGLGYGMGGPKLQLTLATAEPPVTMTLRQCYNAVNMYRETYSKIPELWALLEAKVLAHVAAPSSIHVWGCLKFLPGRIVLPNGMPLMYPDIQIGSRGSMSYAGGTKHLWGGAITENITQALARIVVTRAELRLARAGLRAVHQAHDELIFCVPEEHLTICKEAIVRIMTDPVPWLPNLPVAVEIHHGYTYGDCK